MFSRLLTRPARAAVGLALAAFALSASAAQVVNIGVQPATQPIYIAKAAGYLAPLEAKYNVTFAFHSFPYGAPENQAMAAGNLDLASAGMGPAVVASARLPAKLLGITILEQTAIVVPADSRSAPLPISRASASPTPAKVRSNIRSCSRRCRKRA